jgi:hypothetical protein
MLALYNTLPAALQCAHLSFGRSAMHSLGLCLEGRHELYIMTERKDPTWLPPRLHMPRSSAPWLN